MLTWIIAGASIAGGFVLLWNGGTTSAASLLVLGYCALVPWAILRARFAGDDAPPRAPQARRTAPNDAPPFRAALLAALAALTLYVLTLAPSTAMWDTSEYIAAAKVLGLPHPPGNPLFILVAHVAGAIPLPVDYAVRINLLAAVASASAVGLWFLVAYSALERMLPTRATRLAASAAAVSFGATAFTVWNQSVVNEKVYTLSLVTLALTAWLVVRWMRTAQEPGSARLLVLATYLSALGYAIHPAGFLAIPVIGVAVLVTRPTLLTKWRLLGGTAALFVAGLTPFAYQPIRAAHDPAINEGEPTACQGKIGAACTFSGETWSRLKANIDREQYAKPSVLARQSPLTAQFGMYWKYWKWQWFRDGHGSAPFAQLALALGAVVLVGAGAYAQWRADRNGFWVMATLVGTVTVALIYYLNFRYGYGEVPELGSNVEREVRDRDYFFIWSFSALGAWMGLGLAAAWRALAERTGSYARSAPVLALALVPLIMNRSDAPRSGQRFTREMAYDMLQSAEPGAIVITGGDNDTFPLWYAQEVEGIRRDVTVVISGYLGLDWSPWQLARRVPERFDASKAPTLWASARVPKPRPVFSASREELDSVPPMMELREAQQFVQGDLRAVVGPGYVTRDQLLLLRMIRDTFPERGIYFTNPQFPSSVGLAGHLVQSGLLYRLTPAPVVAGGDIVKTTRGMIDLPRSIALWRDVYRGVPQLTREGDWLDEASISSPVQYLLLAQALMDSLPTVGDSAGAARVRRDAESIYSAARMDRIFAPQ